ncbi:MAG TPA: 4-(cytidine 5'-diphospho)-2-C-methyl-D-erythritol kinase [Porticoccaceae bacterium]|jgi:4-diphosphocytidyl-2-C-methyl-D-erythritol kinase|nr:4-(cytidine 5'-diphospho)-2-C-methyl-D-erythritol kinase [Gammaproteobacteria bacterium]HIL59959.1 4-(cytidine 5'-diphospho)-2-C-methyl-D-erythritol kinase [Porticoccaceae bacterium]
MSANSSSFTTAFSLLAPAKLNLFLHITGRRDDGYHQLQTLFQLLDFGDRITFEPTQSGVISLHCDYSLIDTENSNSVSSSGPVSSISMPMDNNLIMQAARRLQRLSGPNAEGVKITVKKKLPSGAGLGGGSSDAAATLIALKRIWKLDLSEKRLCEIGLELGADLPVFIQGKSAWAEGIGEQLQPVDIEESWYLVITPNCSVSTAEIFCHEHLTRNSPAIKMADFLAGRSRNDCESVTRELYPQVREALKWLSQFGEAKMTGTGSSIFALYVDEESARQSLKKLPEQFSGFVAKGINSLEHRFNEA